MDGEEISAEMVKAIDDKELNSLPFVKNIHSIVNEMLETGQNSYLHSIGEFNNLFYSNYQG